MRAKTFADIFSLVFFWNSFFIFQKYAYSTYIWVIIPNFVLYWLCIVHTQLGFHCHLLSKRELFVEQPSEWLSYEDLKKLKS